MRDLTPAFAVRIGENFLDVIGDPVWSFVCSGQERDRAYAPVVSHIATLIRQRAPFQPESPASIVAHAVIASINEEEATVDREMLGAAIAAIVINVRAARARPDCESTL